MKYQVDVKKVKGIQSEIWDQIKATFSLRGGMDGEPLPIFGHYGGVFKSGNSELVIHTDGVGTKVLVAQELGKYDTVGLDAIAMSVNDILCMGAEPLVGVDYIALAKEDDELVEELMKGLVVGAKESNCPIVGGETAIMPEVIKGTSKPFDLTFTVVGKVRKKIILGNEIEPGDVIVGLESSGLHSNAFTLARKALDSKKWGLEMLTPTRIYVKPVLEMIDNCEIHGIAHITGGAFSKITRLNKEIGYVLDNLPKPKPIFNAIYEKVGNWQEMYRTFNMGIGMVVIVPKSEADNIIKIAKKQGIGASIVGKVIEKKGVFAKLDGKEIELTI
ncbi:phosphoribosylformylglycinamidine cyclo-ligase [Candidatus Micrarchaeota archaeon]|nr:phosphoribosylformylglycinamidine cyclo-ligase [Candidatus Micrarchaeota archaeon]